MKFPHRLTSALTDLRVVRSVMLKVGGFSEVQNPIIAMLIFTGVAVAIAMLRYRQTLD